MTQWLFVSGAGRTGTALLAWCLAQHPDVAMCIHESLIAPKLARLFEPFPGLTPGALEWRCEQAIYEQTEHLFTYGQTLAIERTPKALAQAALRGIQEHLAPERRYLGDKSPAYTMLWPLLRELCPGCEIVFIDREIEATAQSWLRVGFVVNEDQARNEIVRRVRMAQGCPGARWVTLEEMEARPQEVLGMLLEGLGLDAEKLPWEQVKQQVQGGGKLD